MESSSYYLSDLCLEPLCTPYSEQQPYLYGQSFSAFPFYQQTDRRRPSFSFFNSSTSLLPNIDSFSADFLHQRPSFSIPSAAEFSSNYNLESIIPPHAATNPHMPHPHPPPIVHRAKTSPIPPAPAPASLNTAPSTTNALSFPALPHTLPSKKMTTTTTTSKSSKSAKTPKTPKASKKEQKNKAQKSATSANGQSDLPPIEVASPQENSPSAGSSENGRRPLLLKTEKKRVIWTKKLHSLFLQALEVLGHDAMPRSIWSYMEIPGLTRENVASHLQKYKIKLRRERALEEREEGMLADN